MNKIKLIIVFFVFIIIFCVIGSLLINSNIEIKSEEDILYNQNNINKKISVYGYDFNNPNIIINPYNLNNRSALILFETKDYVSINVNINDNYQYLSKKTNRHYIGVYNLVNGYNYIVLSYGENIKKIELYLEEKTINFNINDFPILSNNHLLIPTDKYDDKGLFTGVREVDALGKIYYEYLINEGYSGLGCEIDDEKLALLGNKLIILDRQNGNVISSYDISSHKNNWLFMNCDNSKINLYGEEKSISIDENDNISNIENKYDKKTFSGDINYSNKKAVRFYEEVITKTSNKNIFLFNYSNEDRKDIEVKKEFNRIVISSKNFNNCNNYVILDKFMDRKVYNLCKKINYIYSYDLKGKYSIYFKINDNIYNTGKYIRF